MAVCNKDCNTCKQLNIRVDNLGYPWGYECLKYNDSVFLDKFKDTKEFPNYKNTKNTKNIYKC